MNLELFNQLDKLLFFFKFSKYFALKICSTNNVLLLDVNDFFIIFDDGGGILGFLNYISLFI